MSRFTVLREGTEVAEISIEGEEIEIVPKNILKNVSLVPSLPGLSGIFKALWKSGYRVTLRKGPFEISFKK